MKVLSKDDDDSSSGGFQKRMILGLRRGERVSKYCKNTKGRIQL
jgi:hypothetical protein